MSKKRNKLIVYILIGYLIATGGVNHIINPVVYFQNIFSQEKYSVDIITEEQGLILQLPKSTWEYPYLSFEVVSTDKYTLNVGVEYYSETQEKEKSEYRIEKGINKLKLENKEYTTVIFEKKALENNNVVIRDVVQTGFPKVNLWKTVEIFFSFLLLAIFWEGTRYIKKRYAK